MVATSSAWWNASIRRRAHGRWSPRWGLLDLAVAVCLILHNQWKARRARDPAGAVPLATWKVNHDLSYTTTQPIQLYIEYFKALVVLLLHPRRASAVGKCEYVYPNLESHCSMSLTGKRLVSRLENAKCCTPFWPFWDTWPWAVGEEATWCILHWRRGRLGRVLGYGHG